jgi:oxygen-independent coproporphyrinogen III oxidase
VKTSGIYIHIPFCRRKCSYCDFYLITNLSIVERFLDNLINEIILSANNYKNDFFDSIFIGGGTPSILSGEQVSRILDALKNNYNISDESEITIESNPEDFINEPGKLLRIRDAGINRISFGIQSFNDDELKFLTREHTVKQAVVVIENAKIYFDNISIDLIYSLPNQIIKYLENTLDIAIRLNIPHISAYTLIYEKETPIYNLMNRNIIIRNDDNIESELYSIFSDILISKGYEHYEVSNYAKKGFESKHNLKYWEYANYLGFGPSAHSMWNGKRWNNFRNIIKYNISLQKNQLPIENENILAVEEMKTEFIMLGLRSKGVKLNNYKNIFKNEFIEEFKEQVNVLIEKELGILKKDYFSLTEKGYLLVDEICAKYF